MYNSAINVPYATILPVHAFRLSCRGNEDPKASMSVMVKLFILTLVLSSANVKIAGTHILSRPVQPLMENRLN